MGQVGQRLSGLNVSLEAQAAAHAQPPLIWGDASAANITIRPSPFCHALERYNPVVNRHS